MHHAGALDQFGLLIVNNDLSIKGVDSVLRYASFLVSDKLYVLLRSPSCQKRCEHTWKKYISLYYSSASCVCPGLDICILLPRTPQTVVNKSRIFGVVITDDMTSDENEIIELASAFGTGSDGCNVFRYKLWQMNHLLKSHKLPPIRRCASVGHLTCSTMVIECF